MILVFLCLPIWNVFVINYELGNDIAIELEEKFELENEDTSEKKNVSEKDKCYPDSQYSTKKNEFKQVTILDFFKYSNTSSEVLTQPPEFI